MRGARAQTPYSARVFLDLVLFTNEAVKQQFQELKSSVTNTSVRSFWRNSWVWAPATLTCGRVAELWSYYHRDSLTYSVKAIAVSCRVLVV